MKKLLLMKASASLKMEAVIVGVVIITVTLLPFLGIFELTSTGLGSLLTSVLVPSVTVDFPAQSTSGQKIALEALALAQKTRGYGKDLADATEAYQEARVITGADPSDDGASDCGEFVAVVVEMTYDSSYPKRGTSLQLQYDESHSDIWQQLPEYTPQADLLPGDIFVNSLHTYIYTGMQANGYNAVGASWGGYIPEPAMLFYSEEGQPFHIFRAVQ